MGNTHATLFTLIKHNETEKIRKIIEKIKSIDDYNNTYACNILHDMIIYNNDVGLINYMIVVKQCDINQSYFGFTAFERAICYNRKKIVIYLLSQIPDLDKTISLEKIRKKYALMFDETYDPKIIAKSTMCPICITTSNSAIISFLAHDIECVICTHSVSKMATLVPCGHAQCCIECYNNELRNI